MNIKQVCQLNDEGYFIGLSNAYESPLELGVYHLPFGCVDILPPDFIPDGKRAKFSDNEWLMEDLPNNGHSEDESESIIETIQNKANNLILQAKMYAAPSFVWEKLSGVYKLEFNDWIEYLQSIVNDLNYQGELTDKPFYTLDDNELTPEQLIIRQKRRLVSDAQELIEKTNRFETTSFQSKYWTIEEEADFEQWRHKLFDVIYEEATEIPAMPSFVQEMLN